MNFKGIYKILLAGLFVSLLGLTTVTRFENKGMVQVEAASKAKKSVSKNKVVKAKDYIDDKDMILLKEFHYKKSSETKAYPDLAAHPKAWIDVDIASQRVYIKDGKQNLYTMYSSTGKHDTTPRGTYYVQNERGDYFYTEPLKMGAYYWVSFLHHGEYLFHTTPTDVNGKYDKKISKTLGREPSSHGCIHLSTPDCKWVYDNVPTGMKVVIHGKYRS